MSVLIVGGGPCGLMLTNELGKRGVECVLIDQKATTAFNPQANATQARTMEYFRRHGFADEIRAAGLPAHYPPDIAYFTRLTSHELGRVAMPTALEAKALAGSSASGWSSAELPHRISQKYVESILHKHALKHERVSLLYSWRLEAFEETSQDVVAQIIHVETGEKREIKADFMFAADGPRSFVRKQLGISYGGDGGQERDFMGGRMLALYFDAPDFYKICPHQKAWMYCAFNGDRRALVIAVNGTGEFVMHTQLRPDDDAENLSDEKVSAYFEQVFGQKLALKILARDVWIAGKALVADKFQTQRIFMGGDAVHLFTPTGGMGYNTAIEDAVNIGWKFAAVLKGQAPFSLLQSYEAERRPVAIRNTSFARHYADSIGLYRPSPALESDTKAGVAARQRAGDYLTAHAKSEFTIPGFTFGARYEASPIIAPDPMPSPPDKPTSYVPTGKAGGRAPHIWLSPSVSLYDEFGFEFTLLCLGDASLADGFVVAAAKISLALKIVHLKNEEALDLYESDLILIRPDQVIAWRKTSGEYEAESVLKAALGK